MSAVTAAKPHVPPVRPIDGRGRRGPAPEHRRRHQHRRLAWVLGAVAVVALTAVHLILAHFMRVPIIHPDELGYLDNARYLARGGIRPETEYYPGFSVLLVPIWLVSKESLTVWRGALVINGALAGLGGAVTWALCRRLAPELPRGWRLVITVLVSAYPALLLYSDLALAECLFVLLFGVVVLLAGRALTGGPPAWWAALGLASGLLALVHPRGFAVVIAVLLMAGLVLRWRPNDRLAALALLAGLTLSLGCTRLLVVATRGPTLSGFSSYRPDSVLSRSLSLHGLGSLVWELAGQMSYLSVATLGLVPLGLFLALGALRRVVRGSRAPSDLTQAFAGLAFLGVWALSSLFMNMGTRADELVYGRYNEGAIVPLLIIALADVLAPARVRRFAGRGRTVRRWIVVGVGTIGLSSLMLWAAHHGPALRNDLNPVNVLALDPVLRRTGGSIHPWVLAAAGVALLIGIALIAWRLPALAALAVATVFLWAALDSQTHYLVPGSKGRADQTVIAKTLAEVGTRFGLPDDCVGFVPSPDTVFNYFALRLALPGRPLRWFDPAHGEQPCGSFVVSPDPAFGPHFGGAHQPRLVTLENYVGQGLWVMPGPAQDTLAKAGWLLPEVTPGPLPPAARTAVLTPSGATTLTLAAGATRRLQVRATNAAAAAPWPAQAGLHLAPMAVVLTVRWYPAGQVPDGPEVGRPLDSGEVDLPRTVMPGDTASVGLALVARSDGSGALPAGPLPAGRYQVRVNAAQETGPVFTGPGLVYDVTVVP